MPPSAQPSLAPSAPPTASQASASPGSSTSAGGGSVDACALLPTALLSSILDGEIAFPKTVSSGGWAASQCAWSGPTSSFIGRVGTAASITAFSDPAAPDAKAMLAAFRKQAEATGTAQYVPDIGDAAILGPGGIAARVGVTYLEITKLRLTDEQLVQIMRMAVANL